MNQRIIQTSVIEDDVRNDNVLRPQFLKDYVGQEEIKSNINICIEAAKSRDEALDHVLFYGPPGLGKTTLACIIANELGTNIKITSGPAVEKPADMAAILSGLSKGDVLFIDEIHRLSRQVEEVLYTAMEDFAIDIMIGKGQTSKSIRIELEPFTLIGATTRAGSLSAPLRDRFGVVHRLEFYTVEELSTIIINSANKLGVDIEESGAVEMAKRSRGTPRIANRFLKRIRDYAQVMYDNVITEPIAKEVLNKFDIDELGLDRTDRLILKTMIENYGGKPVGLSAIAASIGEDTETIEDVYEPYLVLKGFINRTPRGRIVSELGYNHLGLAKDI